jgi:hypothetical protein
MKAVRRTRGEASARAKGLTVNMNSQIARGRRLAQRLQIGSVEHVDAEDRLDEIVNGISKQITRGLRTIPGGFPDN